MNMKKAIIIIASTAITLYTIKKRKRKIMKMFYIIHYTLLEKKIKDKVPYRNEDILSFIFPLFL